MTERAKISVSNGLLSIDVSAAPTLLGGFHRILLANVIGLELNEEGITYTRKVQESNLALTLKDLHEYLTQSGIDCSFDQESNKIIKSYEDRGLALNSAKEKGTAIKSNPPKAIEVPNFDRKLKSYQIPAVYHMVTVGNIANFSVPGSGKTTITLAGFSILSEKELVDKLVVIGPRSSFMSWEDEYQACFGVSPRSIRITGPAANRKKLFRQSLDSELVLLSYQMASQDVNRLISLLTNSKALLVLDESHYIKKIEGGKWADTVLSLAPFAKRRVILTGTPVPNSMEDLWTQLTFLWPSPEILGPSHEFKSKVRSNNTSVITEIKRELDPIYWRIHKSQLGLKNPKFHRINVPMGKYQKAIYDVLGAKILSQVIKVKEERAELRDWRRARTIRLLQIASNPTLLRQYSEEFGLPPLDASGLPITEIINEYPDFETPPKIETTLRIVTDLIAKGEKVIVWTSFVLNIKMLERLLTRYNPRIIFGDIPKDSDENDLFNREQMIRDFKNSKKHNLLLANPSACAESISLHKICHHAIYLDRTFNGAQFMQSLDRIHRIGLDPNEQVHYYILLSKNSIDEVIDQRLKDKHIRMLELLNDDFGVLNLESSVTEVSDKSEELEDFEALINHLKSIYD